MLKVVILSVVTTLFCSIQAQEPCSAMDPGVIPPVSPVLYISLSEASSEDLLRWPNAAQYQDEIRINGVIDDSAPNGIVLQAKDDYLWVDPSTHFKFETVSGKNILRLIKPVDRDGPTNELEDDTNVVTFTLVCSPVSNRTIEEHYSVSVLIVDQNDNHPVFINTPYEATVNELLPVGNKVLTVTATDKDINLSSNLTYSIITDSSAVNDGSGLFDIDPLLGHITVKSSLDYESLGKEVKFYMLTVTVKDGSASVQLTSSVSVKITLTDGDDKGPGFLYPGCISHKGTCAWPTYTTNVNSLKLNSPMIFHAVPDTSGNPVSIEARDMDGISSQIAFSIIATVPAGYEHHFTIESTRNDGSPFHRAVLRQTQSIATKVLNGLFEIFIKAEESTSERRHAVAMILFKGKIPTESDDPSDEPVDTSPVTPAAQVGAKEESNTGDEGFSQTTVGLIIAVAVTLTVVVCLAVAFMVYTCRRKQTYYDDKAKLTSNGHFTAAEDASRL